MVSKTRRQSVEHLYDMKAKFGITTEQYAELYRDAVCEVCGATQSIVGGKPARLVIDHDHTIDPPVIRGILCHWCNLAIGLAEDNPALLRALADYLDRKRALTDTGPSGIMGSDTERNG